jgi:hypothetical protein
MRIIGLLLFTLVVGFASGDRLRVVAVARSLEPVRAAVGRPTSRTC